MGAVSGQGLGDLIRDEFGIRWTLFAMIVLLIANGANIIAEFAGAAAALELFGISRYVVVPLVAAGIWALVVFAGYRLVERVFLSVAVVFGAYIVSAIVAGPDWGQVGHALVTPSVELRAEHAAADGRDRRHDGDAVHVLLPAVVGRRQGARPGGAESRARGRDPGRRLDQRHRPVHRGRHRGDPLPAWHPRRERRPGGPGPRPGGGRPGRGPLRVRPLRRLGAGGDGHAADHQLRRLRVVRLGVGGAPRASARRRSSWACTPR